MAEEQRLRRKCNRYAKRLVLLGEDEMIDRYNCEYCSIIGENDMCEAKDGEWVRYEDIKHLLQNTSSNSDYAKCEHDFEPRKTWVHTCRKCGTVQIEKGHFA